MYLFSDKALWPGKWSDLSEVIEVVSDWFVVKDQMPESITPAIWEVISFISFWKAKVTSWIMKVAWLNDKWKKFFTSLILNYIEF